MSEDYAEWKLTKEQDGLFNGWKVEIIQFQSDRVKRKIDEINQKNEQQTIEGKKRKYSFIRLSGNGLETIEWLSLDCSTAEKNAPWHSDSEIKIDKAGYVIKDGVKSSDYWDACIHSYKKPLRLKIRNICGDETIYTL